MKDILVSLLDFGKSVELQDHIHSKYPDLVDYIVDTCLSESNILYSIKFFITYGQSSIFK